MSGSFDDLLQANRAYAQHFELGDLQAAAARGLGVLTCIDSRIEPLGMLGLRPGDAKILRNAGARVTDDVLHALTLATNRLGVQRIMVVTHTDCAAQTTHEELRADVERLRRCEQFPSGTVVGGFEYDVRTGLLRQLS